jgi:hypothetical protein
LYPYLRFETRQILLFFAIVMFMEVIHNSFEYRIKLGCTGVEAFEMVKFLFDELGSGRRVKKRKDKEKSGDSVRFKIST